MEKISVIIPVFNGERFLETTIRSILSQTHVNIEVLIIDDSSTDQSYEMATAFAAEDARVQAFKNLESKGACGARNFGFSLSTGSYVVFHDADDVSVENRFYLQLEYLLSNPNVCGVGSSAELIDENDVVIADRLVPVEPEKILWWELTRPSFWFVHSSMMVRREFFIINGLFEFGLEAAQDKALYIRNIEKFMFYNMRLSLVQYRIHSAQLTERKREKQMRIAEDLSALKLLELLPEADEGFVRRFLTSSLGSGEFFRYIYFSRELALRLSELPFKSGGFVAFLILERNLCLLGKRFRSKHISLFYAVLISAFWPGCKAGSLSRLRQVFEIKRDR